MSKRDEINVLNHQRSHLECVNCVEDLEVLELDKQRKTSWSKMVGSTDSRSIDTGLNELYRITGKE